MLASLSQSEYTAKIKIKVIGKLANISAPENSKLVFFNVLSLFINVLDSTKDIILRTVYKDKKN